MTGPERQRIREARDASKRAAMAEAKGAKSPVVRAVEKAHRAQDAVEIAKTILVPEVVRIARGTCQFCGYPVKDSDVCRAHTDLIEAM